MMEFSSFRGGDVGIREKLALALKPLALKQAFSGQVFCRVKWSSGNARMFERIARIADITGLGGHLLVDYVRGFASYKMFRA
jgi:hypothetical protein